MELLEIGRGGGGEGGLLQMAKKDAACKKILASLSLHGLHYRRFCDVEGFVRNV